MSLYIIKITEGDAKPVAETHNNKTQAFEAALSAICEFMESCGFGKCNNMDVEKYRHELYEDDAWSFSDFRVVILNCDPKPCVFTIKRFPTYDELMATNLCESGREAQNYLAGIIDDSNGEGEVQPNAAGDVYLWIDGICLPMEWFNIIYSPEG